MRRSGMSKYLTIWKHLFYSIYSFKSNGFEYYFKGCILLTVLFVSSCKTKQPTVKQPEKCNLVFKSAKYLTTNHKKNEFHFDQMNAKLNAEAKVDSTFHSFTISLRIHKDSIIWMSISKLGIEGARTLITGDSVYFVNRLDKTYFKGDFTYLSNLLNTQLDFELLQSLLIGNSVEYYDEEEKIKSGVSQCQYLLGTIRKNKLKKVITKGKDLKEPAQSIYIDPQTFKITKILLHEFNPDRNFGASFSKFENADSTQSFPYHIDYQIRAQKEIDIAVDYVKVTLNEPLTFPFKIAENYQQITYNEN